MRSLHSIADPLQLRSPSGRTEHIREGRRISPFHHMSLRGNHSADLLRNRLVPEGTTEFLGFSIVSSQLCCTMALCTPYPYRYSPGSGSRGESKTRWSAAWYPPEARRSFHVMGETT